MKSLKMPSGEMYLNIVAFSPEQMVSTFVGSAIIDAVMEAGGFGLLDIQFNEAFIESVIEGYDKKTTWPNWEWNGKECQEKPMIKYFGMIK